MADCGKKAAFCKGIDPLSFFSKIYNCSVWAMTISLLLGLWLWLGMRANLGLFFYGIWIVLTVLFCFIRKLRFGWKFTAVNMAVCTVFNLVVFGAGKLGALPAVRIREGLGQTRWPLGTVSSVWYAFLIIGFVLILAVGIIREKKAKA